MNKKAFIPISALMGALLLALVATMTSFVADPDIAHAQQSADATLSALTVVGQPETNVTAPEGVTYSTLLDTTSTLPTTLDTTPADGLTTEYDVRIPFVQSGVLVTPTANDATGATITVNGTAVASGNGHQVAVRAGGKTNISIVVTAAARNTETYTVTVYREGSSVRSDNANLSSLGLQGVALSPSFNAAKFSYNARVQAGEVTVSYVLSDVRGGASAAITSPKNGVDGMKVTLAAAADDDAATGGTTTITVTVTPESGIDDKKEYTIEVYRIRENRQTNADLASLTLVPTEVKDGGNDGTIVTKMSFDAATTDYMVRVSNTLSHLTVAATKADAGAMDPVINPPDSLDATGHQVSLRPGGNKTMITVAVTAEDPTVTKTYNIEVYRNRATLSDNANLASLSLTGVTSPIAFSANTETYNTRVAHDVSEVAVSYTQSDVAGGASVEVTSVAGTVSADMKKVTLAAEGNSTDIVLNVTAEDGSTTKTYTVNVYRTRGLASADTTLSALAVNDGSKDVGLSPAFEGAAADARMFDVIVENAIRSVTVTATPNTEAFGATADIMPTDAATTAGHQIALTAGMKNRITITVTAEDRETMDDYMVDVYRKNETASTVNTLSSLSLSDGMLDFMSDNVDYNVRVGNSVGEVTVMATPTDNAGGAMVAIMMSDTVDNCDPDGANLIPAVDDKVVLSAGAKKTICVQVTPEAGAGADDVNVKTYMVTVYRMRLSPEADADLSAFSITEATGTVTIPGDDMNLLTNMYPDVEYRVRAVTVTATAVYVGARVSIMPADADPGTPGHQVNLTAGAETTITAVVTPEDPAAPTKTYTAMVYRKNVPGSESNDATLSSLMLNNASLMPAFAAATMDYTATVPVATPATDTKTVVSAMATHIGAQSGIQVFQGADKAAATASTAAIAMADGGYEVGTLGDVGGTQVIRVTVTAEDETAMKSYFVTVTVVEEQAPRDEAALLAMYDTNGTAGIQIDEAVLAVQHYAAGSLTIEEVVIVVGLYATGG